MFIRFKELTRVNAYLTVGCQKEPHQQIWEFDPGEIFECKDVSFGQTVKVKTRPGKPGGRARMATVLLKGRNENSLFPDFLADVPETAFEIVHPAAELDKS